MSHERPDGGPLTDRAGGRGADWQDGGGQPAGADTVAEPGGAVDWTHDIWLPGFTVAFPECACDRETGTVCFDHTGYCDSVSDELSVGGISATQFASAPSQHPAADDSTAAQPASTDA